jgi:LmbE family N-acetylglucosaminyl deacetylase
VKLGNDESHPWLARLVVHPDHIQVLEAAAPAMSEAAAKLGRARKPMSPREARRCRQEPPCFDGSDTVSRFRPFFRRRERTARPQRVAIRARNPCLVIRRLFRGRYDGFIRGTSQVSRGS